MSTNSTSALAVKLFYVHDPMCSWCWAFKPSLDTLRKELPDRIHVIKLLGGLAPDSEQPMSKETQSFVQGNWHEIQRRVPNTEFNFDFWTRCQPRRSTYPACRAVIAARLQGEQYDDEMTLAIQRAYYLQAKNPSNKETLVN